MSAADPIAAALARNDRYLREFVEAFELCPYARRCRETGALARRVLLQETPDADEIGRTVAALEGPAHTEIDVALLLFPRLAIAAAPFERLAVEVRGRTAAFYVVAFHPELPMDTATPARLVAFLRRSPDPTLQLVRVSTLERVRGPPSGTIYLDPATRDLRAPMPEPPLSVSERIAQANHETVARVGAERLRELLVGMRYPQCSVVG